MSRMLEKYLSSLQVLQNAGEPLLDKFSNSSEMLKVTCPDDKVLDSSEMLKNILPGLHKFQILQNAEELLVKIDKFLNCQRTTDTFRGQVVITRESYPRSNQRNNFQASIF